MRKIYKILFSILLVMFILLCNNVISNAATTSISGKQKVTEGDSVTIEASVTAGAWNLTFSGADKTEGIVGQTTKMDNMTDSKSITFKATKVGTYTFTLKGDVTDYHTDITEPVDKTFTITVEAKPTQNEGSGSSDSSSSSSSSSGNSGSTTTTPKPTFKSKNETVYATDSGVNVRKSYSTSSSILGSLKEGESLTRTGIATEKVNGILWSKVTYKGQTAYVSSSYLTTTKPVVKEEEETENQEDKDDKNENDNKDENQEKSNNTNLKTFEVTPTGLSPAFSNVTTEYTMTVDSEVDKIEIKAVAEDESAKVKISGNEDLKIGTNTINVLVTAEDGTERTYVITVTKERKEQLKLSELLIEGLPLKPEFDENVYEYTLELDKTDISELNITATPSKKSAEIEIVGNTDLKPGENVITILVKSKDGEEITTYQITAKLPEEKKDIVIVEKNNDDLYKFIGIGVAAFALILILILIIRKPKEDDDNEMDDYSELYNRRKKREEAENNETVENQEEINLEKLPELSDEDLPKFLRKDKEENRKKETSEIENSENIKMNEEKVREEKSETSKKIDELYAMSTDEKTRRKGKHF